MTPPAFIRPAVWHPMPTRPPKSATEASILGVGRTTHALLATIERQEGADLSALAPALRDRCAAMRVGLLRNSLAALRHNPVDPKHLRHLTPRVHALHQRVEANRQALADAIEAALGEDAA